MGREVDLDGLINTLDQRNLSLDNLSAEFADIYRSGRPFVPIKQFIEDDYYMGKMGKDLYPDNIPDILDIFDPSKNYIEVIMTGATSIGKTFMTAMALTYMIAQIGNYNEPHKWLGASSAGAIVIINMSITALKAKEVIYTRVKTMVDSSPYFREKFVRDYRLVDSLVWRLSQNPREMVERTGPILMFKPGTGDSLSALGDDIYAGAGDELNFFRVIEQSKRSFGESFDPAQRLYDVVSRRMKGRFSAGGLPLGKFFLLSSAQYPDDFIERRIREAEEAGEIGKTVKVIRKSIWAAKRGVFVSGVPFFNPRTFRVEVGTTRRGSRMLDRFDKREGTVSPLGYTDAEGKVLEVPLDLWDDFARDIEGSVRDYGGETTRAISPFFGETNVIYQAAEFGQREKLEHPWSREETTLEDGSQLVREKLFTYNETEGRWRLARHPKANRYAHVDLAKSNDSAGLAIVHIADWKPVMHEGKQHVEPIFETDMVLRVNPPYQGEIKFSKIREIFYTLRQYGMNFASITYDSYQSADSIQELASKGFWVDTLSVDKDISRYIYLRDCFYDGRISMYLYDKLIVELSRLEKRSDKVDHPTSGSKDVADALCGAVWGAFVAEGGLSPAAIESRLPQVMRHERPDVNPRRKQLREDLRSMEEQFAEEIGGGIITKRTIR